MDSDQLLPREDIIDIFVWYDTFQLKFHTGVLFKEKDGRNTFYCSCGDRPGW